MLLTREQRADGWKTHAEVEREMDEHLARDVAAGLVTPEEMARADQEIERGAPWLEHLAFSSGPSQPWSHER